MGKFDDPVFIDPSKLSPEELVSCPRDSCT